MFNTIYFDVKSPLDLSLIVVVIISIIDFKYLTNDTLYRYSIENLGRVVGIPYP